ncbi:MAG: hypothetical protein PF588_02675 [Candidatus Kapabacteria bacterium]|jgi:hypothetical protein|nr:hypothetical protein [Candidatus Kapabacteria bacterium]
MVRRKLGERDLKQHLRIKKGTSSSSTAPVAASSTIQFTAYEDIDANRAVSIRTDGEADVANLSKPVTAISTAFAPSAALVSTQCSEVMTIADAVFTIGAAVWLCAPDGITGLNMTTTAPTVTAGQYSQRLGRALTADSMLIEIGAAELAE